MGTGDIERQDRPAHVAPAYMEHDTVAPKAPKEAARTQVHGGVTRRWRLALTAAAVVALVAVSVLLARPIPSTSSGHPGTVTLSPARAHLRCIRDAAWSPDGRYVSILGYGGGCPLPGPQASQSTGAVVTYDAASGAVRARFQPDAAILAAVQRMIRDSEQSTIEYHSLLWRHDGAELAISFVVSLELPASAGGTQRSETVAGVFLSAADGSHVTVYTHPLAAEENANGAWNLRSGEYLPVPSGLAHPALAYVWAAGALSPQGSLVSNATPAEASFQGIGQPDGDESFSVWQPAQIVRESTGDATDTTPGAYVYRTSFAAWSPDGTMLVPSMGLSARLEPADQPIPSAQTLRSLGVSGLPLLPVRDAGLATALGRLALITNDQSNGPMLVAWSPDGRMLAVQLVPAEPNAEPHETDHALIVYDCITGEALTALVPNEVGTPLAGDTMLRWSPDGTRLLLYDGALGTVNIWGPGKVPHR